MVRSPPKIDRRQREDIADATRKLLRRYVRTMPTESQEFAEGLVQVFAHFAGSVVDRINRIPDKAYVAFLDLIGAERRPAQAARVPLTFVPSGGGPDSVPVVRARTPVAANPPGEDPVVFETERELILTRAQLVAVWTTRPQTIDNQPVLWLEDATAIATGKSAGTFAPFGFDRIIGSESTAETKGAHGYLDLYFGHHLIGLDVDEKTLVLTGPTAGWTKSLLESVTWQAWDGQRWLPLQGRVVSWPKVTEASRKPAVPPVGTQGGDTSAVNQSPTGGQWQISFKEAPKLPESILHGRSGHWIRGRVRRKAAQDQASLNELVYRNVQVGVNQAKASTSPDFVFAGAVAISDPLEPFLPFGEKPATGDALYIGCEEVFSKENSTIDVDTATVVEGNGKHVALVWEYWNANGDWESLDGGEAGEKKISRRTWKGKKFRNRDVNGESSLWIRIRIDKGNYGVEPKQVPQFDEDGKLVIENGVPKFITIPKDEEEHLKPPLIKITHVGYSKFEVGALPIDSVLNRHDIVTDSLDLANSEGRSLRPFETDMVPTVYLGFQNPTGPNAFGNLLVSLFFCVAEDSVSTVSTARESEASPHLAWQYWNGSSWKKLDVRDETRGFRQRGLVTFFGPVDIQPTSRLAGLEKTYWLRIQQLSPDAAHENSGQVVSDAKNEAEPAPKPSRSDTEEAAQATEPSSPMPRLKRILTNTTWSSHQQTLENEILGSSNGDPSQVFTVNKAPVLGELQLEVREPIVGAVEKPQQVGSRTTFSPAVSPRREHWQTWQQVRGFLDSGTESRHFRVDRVTGEVVFGDGIRGRIPPPGANNIRATRYVTGGGSRGNQPVASIKQPMTTVPYVDSVTNLEPSTGGTDTEDMETLKERGPSLLRHRGRGVAAADYEDLALEVPGVARAKCIPPAPQRGPAGKVELLVLSATDLGKPTPNLDLLRRVKQHLASRMPVTVQLALGGPRWLLAWVDVTIVPDSAQGLAELDAEIHTRLSAFLHPLTGGPDSRGWNFGQRPPKSHLISIVESVTGVQKVPRLEVKYKPAIDKMFDTQVVIGAKKHKISYEMAQNLEL